MAGIRKYYFKKGPPPPNFFVGGVGTFMTGTTQVASELGVSFYKVKSFSATTVDDIQFHIPSSFVQPQLKWNKPPFTTDLTYWYDVGGTVTQINQDVFNTCGNLERVWTPNCTHVGSAQGYKAFNATGIKDFFEMPKYTGTQGDNNYMLNASKVTHLKYPLMTKYTMQWSSSAGRYSHQNITTLKRVYMPLLKTIITYQQPYYDNRFINNIPANTVVYLNSYMETSRLAERYLQFNNVQVGDIVVINGLGYTADTINTSTTFNCTIDNINTAANLSSRINADVRVGTLGDVTTRHNRNASYLILQQTLTGTSGNATTYSASTTTRFVSPAGSTFYSGGTVDRTAYYWKVIRGAELRFITGTTTPDAIVDLSGTNITSTTIDLVFTPPASPDRPIDFYEVWIDDGFYTGATIWQSYFPHQEIAGSGSTVTGLEPATTYTFRVKAADTLYNVSDFSNTFTGTTL